MNKNGIAKHLIVLCHPKSYSFNAAVAAKYCSVVEEHGQEWTLRDLYRMKFDPILRSEEQPCTREFLQSPDVTYEVNLLASADVVVFVYPIWFGMPPAMLKGYVDRVLGSDFSYEEIRGHDSKSSWLAPTCSA